MPSGRNPTPGSVAIPAARGSARAEDFGLPEFLALAAGYGHERFGYVLTPNVHRLMRYYEDPLFRARYRDADFILMDGKFAACLVRLLKGTRLPVCGGADLTALLLEKVARPTDRLVMIGASAAQAQRIRMRYGLADLRHHIPDPGFVDDPEALQECVEFVESVSPFRFCFLTLDSPHQEMIAQALRTRGHARGLAVCVGARWRLPDPPHRSRAQLPEATMECEGTIKPTSA